VPKVAFEDAEMRVCGVARLYERLHRADRYEIVDFVDYLRGLIADLRRSGGFGHVALRLECGEMHWLPTDMVVSLALVIGALVTNAMKHAFPEGRISTMVVGFASAEDVSATAEVADNGVGIPQGFDPDLAERMGMQLVIRLVCIIKADLEILYYEPGVRVIIALPPRSARPK